MSARLSLEGVGVRLPENADRPYALKDVTLSLAANEILCVVGFIRPCQDLHMAARNLGTIDDQIIGNAAPHTELLAIDIKARIRRQHEMPFATCQLSFGGVAVD